ncbi:MAG: glycosyltransferase [Candidatus Zixiibacteriota bacterium]|jgi:glycosyltransferase involved in cell wall biosynthesis
MSTRRILIFGYAGSIHIIRWAKGLRERGFEIKVVSMGGDPIDGVDTTIIPRSSRASFVLRERAALQEARKFNPDIVHGHYATGYGLWASRVRFAPTVLTAWGSDILIFPANAVRRAFLKNILRHVNHITVPSRFLEKNIKRLCPQCQGKMSVIPFGVELPDHPSELPVLPPLRLAFTKAHMNIYGPDILLRAMVKVVEARPDTQLSMAGQGPMTETLRGLAKSLAIDKNVIFTGYIANSEIYSFLEQNHAVVMPSLSESFGVAALEAGACGRPVVASRVGGVPEVVVDGKTGLLVPPGDADALAEAILRLADDRKSMAAMSREGYEFVRENFTWEESLDMMAALYEWVIDEAKKNTTV